MAKRLNVVLDDDRHRRLKVHAAMTGKTMSEAVIELIDNELEKDPISIINESVAVDTKPKKRVIRKKSEDDK